MLLALVAWLLLTAAGFTGLAVVAPHALPAVLRTTLFVLLACACMAGLFSL
ncbi:hypothetical protein [Streptomyces sp. 1331.2]|uniref:hypothetical protein n=1 Tax=Streptomyces sp. 1331.2 TaxID=1938835 RepID=UPI000BD9AF85|nr:hypothetical protein [Streptomyces sp. 1331.2]SOB84221.1 hypothetical protein SAMN06272789_4466 [Streptomyces sp. 1331.2]